MINFNNLPPDEFEKQQNLKEEENKAKLLSENKRLSSMRINQLEEENTTETLILKNKIIKRLNGLVDGGCMNDGVKA